MDIFASERVSEPSRVDARRNVTRACSGATTCVWARGWALYATRVLYPHGNWNDARMIGCKWAAEKWRRETDRRRHDLLWLRRKNLRAGDRPEPNSATTGCWVAARRAVVLPFLRVPSLPAIPSSRPLVTCNLQLRISFSWCFAEILRASIAFRFNRNWILSDREGFTGQPGVMVDWSIIEWLVLAWWIRLRYFQNVREGYYVQEGGRQIALNYRSDKSRSI